MEGFLRVAGQDLPVVVEIPEIRGEGSGRGTARNTLRN